ncbi:MAG: FtsX-like permease family protein [Ferruginibacter sp.]
MIKSFIKTAFRNFWKQKLFSGINMLGLSIGISAALVIYLLVQYEFSFDTFHKDGDRIYRIVSEFKGDEGYEGNSGVPIPVGTVAKNQINGVETATEFYRAYNTRVSITNTTGSPAIYRKREDIVFADDTYFKLFNYDWIAGSPVNALGTSNQVVLSESRAKVYFNEQDLSKVIGRQIIYDDTIVANVTGIVKDFSKATDFNFKEFISFATAEEHHLLGNYISAGWNSTTSAFQVFVKLKPNVNNTNVELQLAAIKKQHDEPGSPGTSRYSLQSLTDIHTNLRFDNFDQRQANKSTLYGLLAVAGFLLLLGCINFINLTTAQASERAKEIGIRKTMGSSKRQLIFQFLSETFVITLVATIISLAITPLVLKMFSDFLPAAITFSAVGQPHVIVFLLLLVIFVSLFSGFYPALVLSRFRPIAILKNNTVERGSRKLWIRKSLTITQFVIAQFLLIATLLVTKQISFSLHKELGYKKDAIITINSPFTFDKKIAERKYVLLSKLKAIPEFEKLTLAGLPPASDGTMSTYIDFNNGKTNIETEVEMKYADVDYFNIYDMKLLSGKYLQKSDSLSALLINNTYARTLGFTNPNDAVGKMLKKDDKLVSIAGVLADFNTKSTHATIKPLAFAINAGRDQLRTFHIALKPQTAGGEEWKKAIAKAELAFKSVYPDDDFEYQFFDESIAAFYKTEQDISKLLKWASALTIFISCLGLLGLVIYTTNQRTKEIGVRKVLGASVLQIVSLLSKDFIWLVLIAFAIAAPLSWWGMHNWLNNFAYRTDVSWWLFAVTGLGTLLIALLILGMRTIGTAMRNPVESLRSE